MGCFAVKINFLTHSMAQGKKQEPQAQNGVPSPSSNIQQAVIQGFTVRGKDVVRLRVALRAVTKCCLRRKHLKLTAVSLLFLLEESAP